MKRRLCAMMLAAAMIFGVALPASAEDTDAVPDTRAVTIGQQPQNGTTSGQPFAYGTAGSEYFRIPSLITLNDGSLLAAADARWNNMSDGGGLDTIVSKSPDSGRTWNYTFANYFGDNGNTYNEESSAFIDSAMVQGQDGTIYLLVDVLPGGVANLNECQEGTGYVNINGVQRLALSSDGENYDYYIGDFIDGYARIYRISDNGDTGYAVNERYYLYSTANGEYTVLNDNIFFAGALYRVFPTSYLWLVTSQDGMNWGNPVILNDQVKNGNEPFYGTGPGRGLVTSSGRIIFPCYKHAGLIPQERTSFIYSDDNGRSWTRTADLSETSSETAVTEANGILYAFTRTGSSAASDRGALTYYTSADNGATWSGRMDAAVDTWTACQMSAVTYSQKIDGKTAILLSAPSGSNRTNGRIYVGLVQEDGSLNWAYSCAVNTGSFEYSCLTELADGSIGILYETGAGYMSFENISIDQIAAGAQIGDMVRQTVNLYLGDKETETVTVEGRVSPAAADSSIVSVQAEDDDISSVEGYRYTIGGQADALSAGQYVFSSGNTALGIDGGALVSVEIAGADAGSEVSQNIVWTVEDSVGGYRIFQEIDGVRHYLGYTSDSSFEVIGWRHTYALGLTGDPAVWSWNNGLYINLLAWDTSLAWEDDEYSDYYISLSSAGWTMAAGAGGSLTAYTVNAEEISGDIREQTKLTFTALAEGTTTVTAGNYLFTVNVLNTPQGDFSNIGTLSFISETGEDAYSRGKTVSHLILTPGRQYDLSLAGADGYMVTWSSRDRNTATVDSNGVVTALREGTTEIVAEIRDAEGIIAGRHIATVKVVEIEPLASLWPDHSRTVEIYVDNVQDSRLYYRQNDEGDYQEVYADTVIYLTAEEAWAMSFFGAPVDENYALTYLSAFNNQDQNQWFAIQDTDNMADTTFYQNRGDLEGDDLYTGTEIIRMLEGAKALGADGGFWFTRGKYLDGEDCRAVINVVSEKLPSLEKSIRTVIQNGVETPYAEGMRVYPGDTIVYDIAVHRYNSQYGIAYEEAVLTEEMAGTNFTDGVTTLDITQDLGADGQPAGDQIFHYEARYMVKESDQDTQLTNRVSLDYKYHAQYSSGGLTSEAEAQAAVSIQAFTPDDYIIDFGAPISVDFSAEMNYDFAEGTADFGKVEISGRTVTYTPEEVLTEADTVRLKNTAGAEYSFRVYPASNIYYEEGFASYSTGWAEGAKMTAGQTASPAGDGTADVYGYDALYAQTSGSSNDSLAVSSTPNAVAEFTFNGTGLDIYALTSQNSGSISLWLYEGRGTDGPLLELGYVNTANNWLQNNDKDYYNTPVFTYKDLEEGTYTVQIVVNKGTVSLDGFRVYGTQGDAYEDVYEGDRENAAQTTELRDIVIAGSSYDPEDINDWYTYGGEIIDAVYDKTAGNSGAVFLQQGDRITADADMINNGPKHEMYLAKDQTIAVKLNTLSYGKVAVGMRSLNGGTVEYELNGQPREVASAVDMYYEITPGQNGEIVITNKGDCVLALTGIRVTGLSRGTDPASVFAMDADTMAYALRCIAGDEAPAATAETTLNIYVKDYKGNAVAETALYASGKKGETHTFLASDIQSAAESVLPDKYAFTGNISDIEAVYGENESCQLQAGKTAVLQVIYRNWLGRTVGTAEIVSQAQTSDRDSYLFTWNDVRKQVPDGYVLINLLTMKSVPYGSEKTLKVTVF